MLSTALGDSSTRAVAAGPHSHTRGLVTCHGLCMIPWHGGLRGCAVDVGRGDCTVREDSLENEVLPKCREDVE